MTRRERRLDFVLNGLLAENHAVPPDAGSPALDFYQVQVMHRFLSKQVRRSDGTLEPLPPQKPTEIDFHRAIAALGQYPKLMRALGIAVDLEVPLAAVPAASNVRVTPSLQGASPMTPWTAYRLDAARKEFFAAPGASSDVTSGMLLLSGPDQYEVVEVDVDGAAEKLVDFASNLARIAFGRATSTIDTPQEYGLPSLRSAGFSCARTGRAMRLVSTFQNATQNNAGIVANHQGPAVVLQADQLTRGFRVDVWASLSGRWHSLCFRDGTYKFLNGPLTRQFADEGFVTVATSQSADGSSPDLRLPESLFRWAGWGLCARRPGRTIGPDSTPASPDNPATSAFKLETDFTVTKGTLPRLRFGALYQFRARAVDLAGNSLGSDAVLDDIFNLPPQPMPYLRYEPVPPPVLVLRQPLSMDNTPGESVERMVIRSNFDTHIAAISERHYRPAQGNARDGRDSRHARHSGRPSRQDALLAARRSRWFVQFRSCPPRSAGSAPGSSARAALSARSLRARRRLSNASRHAGRLSLEDAVQQSLARSSTVSIRTRRRFGCPQLRRDRNRARADRASSQRRGRDRGLELLSQRRRHDPTAANALDDEDLVVDYREQTRPTSLNSSSSPRTAATG